MSIEVCGQSSQGASSVYYLRPSHIRSWLLLGGIGHDRCGPRCNRAVNILVAIAGFATHSYEQIPGLDSARVVFQPAHTRIAALREYLYAIQNLLEGHWERL